MGTRKKIRSKSKEVNCAITFRSNLIKHGEPCERIFGLRTYRRKYVETPLVACECPLEGAVLANCPINFYLLALKPLIKGHT